MPEHLRALIVILVLATVVFAFAKVPVCAVAMKTDDFVRRRNLWFGITLAAFLAHNFWIFMIVAAALLLFALPREQNKLAMFFFLLFAVPKFSEIIPGLGLINYFFTIDYVRLLALAVLLPSFLSLSTRPGIERFGQSLPDKFLGGYIILNLLLVSQISTFTGLLRHGVFDLFIDMFLPYYVASRSLKELQGFRDTLMAFVVAALVLSAIGAFEFARHWLLYASLRDTLGVQWGMGGYSVRGGQEALRALATTGHPIALGYVIAVAAGFFMYLRKSVPYPMTWRLGLILLTAGLIAALSRGPWVGAAAMLLVFVATGPSPGLGFSKLGLLGVLILLVSLISPAGEKLIDYLPFIGTVDKGGVTYRQQLLEVSIAIIMQNPFFGSFDYLNLPAMQKLMAEGIIDIVNSYLGIALASGLVGLSLFSGFFIAVAVGIFGGMRNLTDRNSELYLLGRVLFSTLLGILVIIFTVSSITVIPVVYWSVAGLGVAYARMLALAKLPKAAGTTSNRPATASTKI